MFYAYDLDNKLIVAAADKVEAFDKFMSDAECRPALFQSFTEVELFEVLFDPNFKGLKRQPFAVEFDSNDQRQEFLNTFGVTVVSQKDAAKHCESMLLVEGRNPYVDYGDSKTITEMFDLENNDKWDTRTPEQIEAQEKTKEAIEKAKKEGRLTGDSFGGGKKNTARVRTIHTTLLADGEVRIDKVLAQKGSLSSDYDYVSVVKRRDARANARSWSPSIFFFDVRDTNGKTHVVLTEKHFFNDETKYLSDDTIADDANRVVPPGGTKLEGLVYEYDLSIDDARHLFERHGFDYSNELHTHLDSMVKEVVDNVLPDEDDLTIDETGAAGLFQRLDIEGSKLVDVLTVLSPKMPSIEDSVGRDCKAGCWIAFLQHSQAEFAKTILDDNKIVSEITAVNAEGTPIIAKGVSGVRVIDENAKREESQRPWNKGAADLDVMSEDEKKENKESYNGQQFLYTGMEIPNRGCRIYVVPASYFKEHEKMWDKALDIAGLLPDNLKEVSPGVYETRYWQWTSLHHMMQTKGFRDSILFRQYVNSELL